MVVLKRLADALRDGDRVLAVVRGSAVNQDGRSNGLTAPNALAQRDVITDALRAGDVAPDTVNYVEAHGTGTVLGDPIEFEALAATYGRGDGAVRAGGGEDQSRSSGGRGRGRRVSSRRCWLFEHGHDSAEPAFHPVEPGHRCVVDPVLRSHRDTRGRQVAGPRRAGVSSFGFGGTNAHVVMEQAPDVGAGGGREPEPAVTTLVVSGKTPERVASWAAVLADWMDGAGAGVRVGRGGPHAQPSPGPARPGSPRCVRGTARRRWPGCGRWPAGQPAAGVVGPHEGPCGPGTVFVYSGQGSQWAGMGRQLLADEPAFAAAVAELEPDFVEQTGFSLQAGVGRRASRWSGIDRIQPVLVGVQLALTALWRSYGVEPDAVIGHSMGEVSAAVVAGALSRGRGAAGDRHPVAVDGRGWPGRARWRCWSWTPDGHRGVDRRLPRGDRGGVRLAAPDGDRRAARAGRRGDRGGAARRTGWPGASMSTWPPTTRSSIRSCPNCAAALAGLAPAAAERSRSSAPPTTTAGRHRVFDADYWAANLRNPVRFGQAVATAGADHTTFIEISPHPLLTHAITDTLAERHHHSVGHPAARHPRHAEFSHQPQRHPHHPPAADRAPTRTPPATAHHPVAPHPALDHHHRRSPDAAPQRHRGAIRMRDPR